MAKPVCRDCGSEAVEWRKAKSGAWYLVELHVVPHMALCPKRKKAKRPKAVRPATNGSLFGPEREGGATAAERAALAALLGEAHDLDLASDSTR